MTNDMDWFAVNHLDVDRLLAEWRWLCPNAVSLIARNAFGDLFLRDGMGQIHRLNVAIGKLLKVADSEAQFKELATSKREEWFAESDEVAFATKGLKPNPNQCIGFAVPLVFRTTSTSPNNPYVAELYEHVSFLGDINGQIASLPDGTEVRFVIGAKPQSSEPSVETSLLYSHRLLRAKATATLEWSE